MGAQSYKPTKAELGKIRREVKNSALAGEPSGLLAYANMQLAEAIRKQTEQHAVAA